MGGTREAAKRAEGTRRRPLRVRRETSEQKGKYCAERNGESGDWSKGGAGRGKKEKGREKVKKSGLELRTKKMVAKGRKAEPKSGFIQDTTAWRTSGQKRDDKLHLKQQLKSLG